MVTKAIKSAAGNDFNDEDVVKWGLAEDIWKQGLPAKLAKVIPLTSLFSSFNTSN
jgi:hypothetical protein